MIRPLVIIGCGGFGREVFSIVAALRSRGSNWYVEGFVDDGPSHRDAVLVADLGSRLLGSINELGGRGPVNSVIAIGSGPARASISQRLSGSSISWATLVHPDTTVGLQVDIGEGTIIAAGARLSTNIRVGRHVQIDQNATIGHDTEIGDFSRLNPQACVSGSVVLGNQVMIGAGATVLQGLRVNNSAVVGAGAVVVRDICDSAKVKGVPAR